MANWYFTEYNGRLAITFGWSRDKDTPTETRPLWIHPTEKYTNYYNRFTKLSLRENNTFIVFDSLTNQLKLLRINDWEMVNDTRDIPKPGRGGKNWQWEWSTWLRAWIKS